MRYVASDERSFDEVVRVVGAALGRPDLRWVIFSDEQMRQRLLQSGLPGTMADDVVNLYRALGTGRLGEEYQRQHPALGEVKLEDFAQEFAATFQPNSQ